MSLFRTFVLLLLLAGVAHAAPVGPDAAVDHLLQEAAASPCTAGADNLVHVLCRGVLRVGVRGFYPGFGTVKDGQFSGYEPALARRIAARLGVAVSFTEVTPATRLSALGEDRVDLVIATMGHTVQRDSQALFIRPHYYASETVVVGPRSLAVSGWAALAGNTVCVTIGASSNQDLFSRHVRLLLFDSPARLLEALQNGACPLIAQDDSLLNRHFADPAFAARYDVKLRFGTLPWGMAVPRHRSSRWAALLSQLSQQWHRDGTFLALAQEAGIELTFLHRQQALWRSADCAVPFGSTCLLQPEDSSLVRLRIAGTVEQTEVWLHDKLGLTISLPMLKTAVAFQLFVNGLIYTVILIGGAIAFTISFAVLFGAAIWSGTPVLAPAVRMLTLVLRSSPIVLLLFVGFTAATALTSYSLSVALVVAMVTLGLFNGSYAAHALADVHASLRRERGGAAPGWRMLAGRSAVQMTSFVVNATKGSAAASMIGAPELLGAMTDISSISNERITLYSVLLICTLLMVFAVMGLCAAGQRWLARGTAVA